MNLQNAVCFFFVLFVGGAMSEVRAFSQDDKQSNEDVLSVQEFLALKEKWSRFAAIKLPIVIEGRLGARSDTQFRMRQCDLFFRAMPKQQLPPIASKTENVITKGYLEKRGSRFSFVVQSLKSQPSDWDAFTERRLKLSLKEPKPWYEAAKWARNRAEFYEDKKLLEASQTAAAEGIRLEREALPASDGVATLKLAAKADTWKLPATVSQRLRHEAYRQLWAGYLKNGKPTFTELHTGLTRDLPGATTVLKDFPTKLAAEYAKNPFETYLKATAETRPVLNRLFYLKVMQQQIESSAKPDGSNGYAIAAMLEKQLPDLTNRAEFHRRKELAFRMANIEKSDRDGAVALAAMLRKRNEPERATAALKTWLKAQEAGLRQEGATGLIHLSDETMRLLNDRQQAIALLKEADNRQPDLKAVADRMLKFGFRRHGNAWVTAEEFAKRPVDHVTKKARSGKVTPGMSPAEVRRAVAGTPSSVMRSVTHRTVSEVWVFRQPDRSRLIVHFQRKLDEQRSQTKATRVLVLPN